METWGNPTIVADYTALWFRNLGFLHVSADVKLTRVAEVKLTHLGEDGGFGTAYVDPGAVRGDSGVVSTG